MRACGVWVSIFITMSGGHAGIQTMLFGLFLVLCDGAFMGTNLVSSNAPLLEGLTAELSKEFPAEPRLGVEGALQNALASAAAAEDVSFDDLSCVRDYSATCPNGWVDVGDGSTCSAAFNYKGPCPATVTYGKMTPREKQAIAHECQTLFPCVDAFVPDYAQACPAGWSETENQYCLSPIDYTGPCVGKKRFSRLNIAEKAFWAESCGVTWPRRAGAPRASAFAQANRTCGIDHDAPCPFRWTLGGDGKLCRAPTDYEGACARFADFTTYSTAQRQAFAELCKAPWPCAGDARE